MGTTGHNMQRPTANRQPARIELVLKALATLKRISEQRCDSLFSKLSQSQPELQDFSGSGALQTLLTTMTCTPGRFHVGQTRGKGISENVAIGHQQQR